MLDRDAWPLECSAPFTFRRGLPGSSEASSRNRIPISYTSPEVSRERSLLSAGRRAAPPWRMSKSRRTPESDARAVTRPKEAWAAIAAESSVVDSPMLQWN